MKMEQTECSETSAYRIQIPENYPEENIQHTEHGESLKSRISEDVIKCDVEMESMALLVVCGHCIRMCTKVRIKFSPKHVQIGASYPNNNLKCHYSPLQYSHATRHGRRFSVCWIQIRYSRAYVQQKSC